MEQSCVVVRNVSLKYGRKEKSTLNNMNMNIPKGVIYGLLGPSACGKTSILRCILGILKPNAGQISIFGHEPGTKQSFIPGPNVGYMPQEIALYNVFTIEETIFYFATIFNLPMSVRKSRLKALLKFLDLPDKKMRIQNLSGGQKRRVSIAACLVHKPPLLILDEPTVGVDPLLRESIWKQLNNLTQSENMTILITTHYVEEAKQAHLVGLMRKGALLVEDNPMKLIKKYSSPNLEEVFLRICHLEMFKFVSYSNDLNEQLGCKESASLTANDYQNNNLVEIKTESLVSKLVSTCPIFEMTNAKYDSTKNNHSKMEKFSDFFGNHYNKVQSQIKKSFAKTQRNLGLLTFQLILPALTMFFFCLCIGNDIKGLSIAVYNGEVNYYNYSKILLDNLREHGINLAYVESEEKAISSVREGHFYAALVINANYSYSLKSRISNYYEISNESLAQSTIKFYSDQTEMPVQLSLQRKLYGSIGKFLANVVEENLPEIKPESLSTPLIENMEPIYGNDKLSYRDYMAPAIILAVSHAMAIGLTALAFVQEKKDGILERSLVSGVSTSHIFIAHFLVEFVIMFFQTIIMLVLTFVVFDVTLHGSMLLVMLLTLVQGACGVSFGMLISTICKDEQSAIMLTLAIFYPNLIVSGMIWPIEGMHFVLNVIVHFLPQTFSVKAIRAIVARNWDLTHSIVIYGFASTFIWIIIFNIFTLIIYKRKLFS